MVAENDILHMLTSTKNLQLSVVSQLPHLRITVCHLRWLGSILGKHPDFTGGIGAIAHTRNILFVHVEGE